MKLIILKEETKKVGFINKTHVLNDYHKISELDYVLRTGFYEWPLGYDKVDWFVDEVKKLEIQMVFLKTLRKISLCSKKMKNIIEKANFVNFVKKVSTS